MQNLSSDAWEMALANGEKGFSIEFSSIERLKAFRRAMYFARASLQKTLDREHENMVKAGEIPATMDAPVNEWYTLTTVQEGLTLKVVPVVSSYGIVKWGNENDR